MPTAQVPLQVSRLTTKDKRIEKLGQVGEWKDSSWSLTNWTFFVKPL